jgi:hypothetical protein
MATKTEIENAILESTGSPDSGVIRDNLGVMVDAVLRVINPSTETNFKDQKETRIVKTADHTR